MLMILMFLCSMTNLNARCEYTSEIVDGETEPRLEKRREERRQKKRQGESDTIIINQVHSDVVEEGIGRECHLRYESGSS